MRRICSRGLEYSTVNLCSLGALCWEHGEKGPGLRWLYVDGCRIEAGLSVVSIRVSICPASPSRVPVMRVFVKWVLRRVQRVFELQATQPSTQEAGVVLLLSLVRRVFLRRSPPPPPPAVSEKGASCSCVCFFFISCPSDCRRITVFRSTSQIKSNHIMYSRPDPSCASLSGARNHP